MCTDKTQANTCSIDTNDCVFSRRCFMTGEYCSKQRSIQRERYQLHSGKRYEESDVHPQVNAFVIMNFSSMSDVIYKWRIKPFVEGLKNYLYFDEKSHKLICDSAPNAKPDDGRYTAVDQVNVIRADTNPSSNFVICNRICQQMQIADIVVVDVSDENANVFYELGLAVAFGKMILPICYSESYFKEVLPEKLAKILEKEKAEEKDIRHHIDCFPWRRKLFEHFGLLFRDKETSIGGPIIEYKKFEETTRHFYGFSDHKWVTFPYYEKFDDRYTVGESIYDRLKKSFSNAENADNTLIVYSMDRILNPWQAGQCIINYRKNIVKRFEDEKCFCGDRVGVLIQPNAISEDTKDAEYRRKVPYKVGEIILTGLNQATFQTELETIKTDEYLKSSSQDESPSDAIGTRMFEEDLSRFAKEYMRNRGLPIYPEIPIHVQQLKAGIQYGVLDKTRAFSFFGVMLQTLKYCNEIVVDISNNIVQMLFWLGAAHGAGIPAVTVKYLPSADELKEQIEEASKKSSEPLRKERNIFDVSGLWTAVLYSNRTDLFYKQLVDVQRGIKIEAKRLIPEIEDYENAVVRSFLTSDNDADYKKYSEIKKGREKKYLESYYRIQLWRHMLLYNSFVIYAPLTPYKDDDQEDQEAVSLWDVKGLAKISNYLSKRKTIGNYEIIAINQKTKVEDAEEDNMQGKNYLCLGKSGPHSNKPLAEFIGTLANSNSGDMIFSYDNDLLDAYKKWESSECPHRRYQGFKKNNDHCYSQIPISVCFTECEHKFGTKPDIEIHRTPQTDSLINTPCLLVTEHDDTRMLIDHQELGQLVLWRDDRNECEVFRVAVSGASGPATYAVSTVLIDLEQKAEIFGKDKKDKEDKEDKGEALYPLSRIQKAVREQLINKYKDSLADRLKTRMKEVGQNISEDAKKYIKRVVKATETYLNSTLFKFVFPFLSIEDIDTIANGMQAYINSMQSLDISPFSLDYKNTHLFDKTADPCECPMDSEVVRIAESIAVETLKETLESLFCIEVMFEVAVGTEDAGNKNFEEKRKVTNMKFFKVDKDKIVNCIYKEKAEDA